MLASEFSTGKLHGGRIDTLGIDENDCPVIIEYKRSLNESVVNQGLFYLNWLIDHKGDFEMLVLKKLGPKAVEAIEWSSPRLICIAGDFTKFDESAVQLMNRNIDLIRYRRYGSELLLLELVNRVSGQQETSDGRVAAVPSKGGSSKTFSEYLAQIDPSHRDRYESLKAFLESLGDDVELKVLKNYAAFKRIKNFACVEVHPATKSTLVYVKSPDPKSNELIGFARDVTNIGHFGTGNLELTVRTLEDVEKAKPFILKSYEAS